MKVEVATEVIEGLTDAGVNFVGLLPESEFLTAQNAIVEDERFTCVPVCNETSGVSVCAGAWAGGKRPVMMMGAAGFTVSIYALAGVCLRHGIPVPLLVTSRELGDESWIFSVWNAYTLEPGLKGLTIPFTKVDRVADVRRSVRDACKTSYAWLKPTAVLLTGDVVFDT